MNGFQSSQESRGEGIMCKSVEKCGRSFLFRAVICMDCGSLDEMQSIALFRQKKRGAFEMRDAKSALPASAVTGGGFFVGLSDELESLRLPAH